MSLREIMVLYICYIDSHEFEGDNGAVYMLYRLT